MCETDDEHWIQKLYISSQAFHETPARRVREITAGERFEQRILESLDPVTQER
jgi:hypothetical protein